MRWGWIFLFTGLALALVVGSWRGREPAKEGEAERREESLSPEAERGEIFVHVAGAVARPGLYRLPRGARVGEAVALAGGFREEADRGAVNLARVLRDGEQVRIPARSGVPPEGNGVLDLNAASLEELERIPGVGPVLAKRIVEHREKQGPFGSPEDLLRVPGIGPSKLREIKAFLGLP